MVRRNKICLFVFYLELYYFRTTCIWSPTTSIWSPVLHFHANVLKFRPEPFTSAAPSRRYQNAPLRWKLASLNIQNLVFNLQTHYGDDLAERKLSHGSKFCILLWTQTARLNVLVIYCRSGCCSPELAHVKTLLVQERITTLLSRWFTILNSTAGHSRLQATSMKEMHLTRDLQFGLVWGFIICSARSVSGVFNSLAKEHRWQNKCCEEPQRPEAHHRVSSYHLQLSLACCFIGKHKWPNSWLL